MSWKLAGGTSGVDVEVDPKHEAARVSLLPMEIGARGAYSIGGSTGILPAALAANSEVFQFRFVSAGGFLAILRSVKVSASVSTTMFAAGVPIEIEMRRATGWTVQGTGGTGITFGANDGKKRTDFPTTAIGAGDVRYATTAALGVGTKSLDGIAVRNIIAGGPITASLNGTILPVATILWMRDTSDEYPFLFENNEGFVIRVVAVPATGTWRLSVEVEWSEVDPAILTNWS